MSLTFFTELFCLFVFGFVLCFVFLILHITSLVLCKCSCGLVNVFNNIYPIIFFSLCPQDFPVLFFFFFFFWQRREFLKVAKVLLMVVFKHLLMQCAKHQRGVLVSNPPTWESQTLIIGKRANCCSVLVQLHPCYNMQDKDAEPSFCG